MVSKSMEYKTVLKIKIGRIKFKKDRIINATASYKSISARTLSLAASFD